MNVGLIVYDHPTPKTEAVMAGLRRRTDEVYSMFGIPFKARAPREQLFKHRPDWLADHPARIAAVRGIPYVQCTPDQIDGCDIYLILGAGIIPVNGRKILNCHPGLTPAVRGLDAFKWAIHDDQPLGCTLHYIDDEVDAGETVYQQWTPIYAGSTIEELARGHWWGEIHLLRNWRYYIKVPRVFKLQECAPHKRMDKATEQVMLERWPAWRAKWQEESPYYQP